MWQLQILLPNHVADTWCWVFLVHFSVAQLFQKFPAFMEHCHYHKCLLLDFIRTILLQLPLEPMVLHAASLEVSN